MADKKDRAREMYLRGDADQVVADACGVTAATVFQWALREGWTEERAAKSADEAVAALAAGAAADKQFVALADSVRALAASVATKAKAAGLKAKDVLDLAKAVDLAQRIRDRAEEATERRRQRRRDDE